FAQAVIGKKYEYSIPAEAYPTEAEIIGKKGTLAMASDAACEGDRCLSCNTICQNCADVCPNRANVVIRLADGRTQILHVDKMCNECGNCTAFCPYNAQPCKDKFTIFQTEEDFVDSENFGFLFLADGKVRVRLYEVKDYTLGAGELPSDIEEFITTVKEKYSYLY
ncbi:MAG: putative selenate reductase subunit YgfK, partial [Oscillospiraceae bacterium]|nr:putative selenate reductase subunit YgfK [Oscillospiraceae bacterium]